MPDESKEIQFEAALKKLEAAVDALEKGDLSLEDALKQYEMGVKMADICSKRLTEAKRRVEVLLKSTSGKLETKPFEEETGEIKPKKKK